MTSKVHELTDQAQEDLQDIRDYSLDELAEFYNENVDLFDVLVKNKNISKASLRRSMKYMMRIPLRSHEIEFTCKEEMELAELAKINDQIKFHMAIKEMHLRMDKQKEEE